MPVLVGQSKTVKCIIFIIKSLKFEFSLNNEYNVIYHMWYITIATCISVAYRYLMYLLIMYVVHTCAADQDKCTDIQRFDSWNRVNLVRDVTSPLATARFLVGRNNNSRVIN